MKPVPYDTGKVRIGCRYQRPLPNLVESKDAQLIQWALLNSQPKSIWSVINRLVGL